MMFMSLVGLLIGGWGVYSNRFWKHNSVNAFALREFTQFLIACMLVGIGIGGLVLEIREFFE